MFGIIKKNIDKAQVIESYIAFIKGFTELEYITKENVHKLVNKNGLARFMGKYECSLFKQFKNYALRFKDNMSSDEFVDVFNMLKEHFGNPTYFSEYKGYVWQKDDIIISYGLVSLNYNYEVPLIQFGSKIAFINHKIDYVEYKKIADIFKNSLSKHKLELNNYYEIMYTKEFGYIILIMNRSINYYISYHKHKIKFTVNELRKDNSIGIRHNTFNKCVTINDDSELENKLDEIFNEYESSLSNASDK